jgi:hypothetical protein
VHQVPWSPLRHFDPAFPNRVNFAYQMVNELLICLNILLNIGKIGHFPILSLGALLQNAAIDEQFSPKQVQWKQQEIRSKHDFTYVMPSCERDESLKWKTNKGKQERRNHEWG